VLYPTPGYPIYESQVEYFGGIAQPYRYTQTATGFAIDFDHLRSQITPATKVLIYNNLQNPLGCESSLDEMRSLAELAVQHNLWVLSDEAYFEMRYAGTSTSIASLPGMLERTVILYTFSKKFAMTGWRLGAAVGPDELIAQITKINTNDESCTTHFVQAAGVEALQGDQSGAQAILAELERRRDAAVEQLQGVRGFVIAKPDSTFYLFPNVTEAMNALGFNEVAEFADAALRATGVSFCTRRHFGRPLPGETQQYVRFAYSGISVDDIQTGIGKLRDWIEAA
jgi:aspartate/methionine/tyrosine aminotransferase